MKPLSILHTESSIGWGGQEIRILTEMAGFMRRGHRVHLLTPECADLYPAAQKLGIPVTPIPMVKKTLPALWAVRRWLADHGREFDIANTHSSTDSWLVALARASLSGSSRIVRTRHVSTAINHHATTRWLYQRATDHIVTTGEVLKTQLVRDNGFDAARITSVRTGIDLARYRPLGQADCRAKLGVADRPTLGILATLRDWKGHDVLLDAWEILNNSFPDWQLIIIGDGPRRGHLEGRVDGMGLRESVRFVGNQDNVPEWLACLDLFTLPSWGDEGVPQGIMQAMAEGLAVVSTPVGAVREAVVDGLTGLLAEPRDPASLSAALGKLMSDGQLRQGMGEAGLKYARENFGVDIMLDKMEAVFRRVLERHA
ncbi:MAG: glycosyltransferase family 4 protein [Sulfuricella sp.]|nr:glycosyltransferase family 4 protein [Sulfuricella sp.]